ncbi:hypothetical protein GCM10027062_13860 [Nocardioides hungaricus]
MPQNRRALIALLLSVSSALLALVAVAPPATAAAADIRINEVESNGGTPGDWVELVNIGADPVDVSGWRIKDDDDTRTFAIPSGTTVPAGGFVAVDVDVAGGFGLGSSDSARVYLPDGTTLIDSYSWTGGHAATTYGRCPDGTGAFRLTTSPTKGAANDCSSPVRINEIESSDGGASDWVELTNPSAAAVDASGLVLRDSGTGNDVTVPGGTTIPAGGYLAVDVTGLGSGDTARLFDGPTLVDSYTWTEHASTTYGRCPDGTGPFTTTASSTKGAANSCPGGPDLSGIAINEVESSGGVPGDWVELVNTGETDVDLGGLVLKDSGETGYTIPDGTTIAAGGYRTLEEADFGFGLGGGDSARLFAPDGTTLVDSYTWTSAAGTTYGRCPDGYGPFATTLSATKGAANDCTLDVPSTIVINEVESNGGTPGDWVELKNTGASAVSIAGLRFKDNGASNDFYAIPRGTVVAPGGYYLLEEADFGFGLGVPDDAANLYAADESTVVDRYAWTTHATTTYGRCPDGTGAMRTTTSSTKGAANDCSSPIRINEVESNGGTPGDWVELVNPSPEAVSVGGWVLRDSGTGNDVTIASGTTIAAGGYLAVDVTGLGAPDSARLFDGATLVDSVTWTDHAATTLGRCPDGTGAFATTREATRGARNACVGDLVTGPWPGGESVRTVDPAGVLGGDISGITYAEDRLWTVKNGTGELIELTAEGDGYAVAERHALRYPGTEEGAPDTEGLTFTDAGPAGGLYVSSERSGAAGGTSRPSVLRYDVGGSGDLTATREWNLVTDLPPIGANSALEGIAWVPDSYLVANGFRDENTRAPYDPATYPGHGSGLFLVGVEANGMVYAYALLDGGGFTRVASFTSGFPAVMDLSWDPERVGLWAVCDDGCQGRTTILRIADGAFAVDQAFERPAGMANLNNEGFAVAPQSRCVGGVKPAFWTDDGNTGGNAIREGTISCTDLPAPPAAPVPQTITVSPEPPATPVVGQTWTIAAQGGGSGQPVLLSTSTPTVCTLAGSTVTFAHPGTCTVRAQQAGDGSYAPGSTDRTITVARAETTTTVAIGAGRQQATVAPVAPGAGAPNGTVTFAAGGTVLGTATLANGVATLGRDLPAGATGLTATYAGDEDFAGSTGTATRSQPRITAALSPARPPSGWWTGPVTVTFTCTPGGAPLTAPCPAPVTLSDEGADGAVTRTITATDGGAAEVTVAGIDIDGTGPTVRVRGPRDGATYRPGKAPKVRCQARDALSGLASCELDRSTAGIRRGRKVVVVATAVDRAGNVATDRIVYRIRRR